MRSRARSHSHVLCAQAYGVAVSGPYAYVAAQGDALSALTRREALKHIGSDKAPAAKRRRKAKPASDDDDDE